MKTNSLALAVLAVTMSSSVALANSDLSPIPVKPVAKATLVSDVNVVNPNPNPAPPPPSTATVVQPVQQVPVQAVPAPGTQKMVQEQVEPPHNYMATVALSALMGGVAGLLVGGSIYYLGHDQPARNIGYWTAGGVLVGTGVGIVQIVVQEDRADRAVGFADPAPTYRLSLLRARF